MQHFTAISNKFYSIFACSSRTKKLNPETVTSLGIEELCNSLAKGKDQSASVKEILVNLCCEEDVIIYRNECCDCLEMNKAKEFTAFLYNYVKVAMV